MEISAGWSRNMPIGQTARGGGAKRRRKLGEIVAERIVAEIIRRGWNEGEVLGTEQDFMDFFRISRATFREAVRQLEWSGAAGMRRGASGGLVVKAPPRDAIVHALKTYFELTKVERPLLDETAATLRAAPRMRPDGAGNQATELFLEALDSRSLSDLAQERLAGAGGIKLSETVAQQLVREIEARDFEQGANLGNEIDLQRRFGVSRAVLREALRPLELHDIIRVKTGAHGGIIIHGFDPDYTITLATTYLAFARLPLSDLWEVQNALKLVAVEGFVARADAARLRLLERALERLEQASAPHYLMAASEFHLLIADNSGNRAAALFVGVLHRYGLTVLPRPDEAYLPMLKQQHRDLLEAANRGDAASARASMQAMYDHSRRWIARIERDLDRRAAQSG